MSGAGFTPSDFMIQSSIVSAASQSVTTGYHFFDAILIILIMSIVGSLKDFLPSILQSVKDWVLNRMNNFRKRFVRFNELVIEDCAHHYTKHSYISRPEFKNTMHLIRAIELYLDKHAKVEAISVNVDDNGNGNNAYDRMKKNNVLYSCKDKNIELPNGVKVMYEKNIQNSESGEHRLMRTTITLRSSQTHQFLKDFVQQCLDEYIDVNFKEFDTKDQLYFYTLDVGTSLSSLKNGMNTDQQNLLNWRRYDLTAKRTFDSLFFDQKPEVLRLIQNFTDKSGMFSFDSVPYKLSFLLHGPPGSGKTSFIEALAKATNRHVVTPSLPLIKTNGQLLDAFHNKKLKYFKNWGQSDDKVPISNRIYVLEDIDALDDIVKKRANDKKKQFESATSTTQTMDDEDDSSFEAISCPIPTPPAGPSMKYKSSYERYSVQEDELNLSGLLNALDGLLKLNGAIIVITTNHPEHLDPALIRPGRITMKLEMSYMSAGSIKKMLEYYFKEEVPLSALDNIGQITPAMLENICLSHPTPEAVLKVLHNKYSL